MWTTYSEVVGKLLKEFAMTATTILFAVLMIASGAVRMGLILLAIWALIRLVDRLRTPIVVNPVAANDAPAEQPAVAATTEA
ncbi:MAG: hypothetical protein RLY87_793 [Chloroflexota bacterium]|jgi:hypothetical protein